MPLLLKKKLTLFMAPMIMLAGLCVRGRAEWESSNISNRVGLAWNPQLALDSSGFPHVFWLEATADDYITAENPHFSFFYLKWNGSEWVDVTGQGQESIAITEEDFGGTNWNPVNLALDKNNQPCIAFNIPVSSSFPADQNEKYYLKWNGAKWAAADGIGGIESARIAVAASSQRSTFVLDEGDNPHMFWIDRDTYTLTAGSLGRDYLNYLKWNGSEWVDVTGDGQESMTVVHSGQVINGESVRIRTSGSYSELSSQLGGLDSSGNPYVIWQGTNTCFLRWNGAEWVDIDGYGQESLKIRQGEEKYRETRGFLDKFDQLNLVWMEKDIVYYLKWNGNEWVDASGAGQESKKVAEGIAHTVGFGQDGRGFPYVAVLKWDGEYSSVHYTKWDGYQWSNPEGNRGLSYEIIKSTNMWSPFFNVEQSGNPHFVMSIRRPSPNYTYDIHHFKWVNDIAPDAVTDLAAETGVNEGCIALSWTSPGDDGTKGNLTGEFRIAYSTSSSPQWSKDNYGWRILADNLPPLSASQTQLTGLTPGVTYYFRMWCADEAANWSEISNGASAWAQYPAPLPPDAPAGFGGRAVSPDAIQWEWDESTSNKKGYYVRTSSGGLLSALLPFATYWIEEGLSANTSYYRYPEAYNDAGASSGTASAAFTMGTVPSSSTLTEVSSNTISLQWEDNGNPPWTEYEAQWSTKSLFTVLSGSAAQSGACAYNITELSPNTIYHIRVRSVNGDGIQSGFDTVISTRTYADSVPVVGALSGAGRDGAILWTWADEADNERGYEIKSSTGLALQSLAENTTYWIEEGLSVNTSYYRYLEAYNEAGRSQSAPDVVYTLAVPPSESSITVLSSGSLTIAWQAGDNPPHTLWGLERAEDSGFSSLTALISSDTNQTDRFYTDSGLAAGSTYWYRIYAYNGDGIASVGDVISAKTFVADDFLPAPADNFRAESLEAARIKLSWDASASTEAAKYNIYWDAGAGEIDYLTALARVVYSVREWTTGALQQGTEYKFGIRVEDASGNEEKNTDRAASAYALGSFDSALRAAIRVPGAGRKVSGNSLTVIAELTEGEAAECGKILFQYRSAGGVWQDISASNANHPNPDYTEPYFVHWDVSLFSSGQYELRAVAYDTEDAADANPPAVTIVIDHAEPDQKENRAGNQVEKQQKLDNRKTNTVESGASSRDALVKVEISSGALNGREGSMSVVINPQTMPPAPGRVITLGDGASCEINLAGGQTMLLNDKEAVVTFMYEDADNDGFLDYVSDSLNIALKEDYLAIYRYNESRSRWEKLVTTVDGANNMASARTRSFSHFALFASLAETYSGVKVYPNPFKPSLGHTEIHFENLTINTDIEIFTVSGTLVWRREGIKTGEAVWDTRNQSGRKVASGVYICLIRNDVGDKTVVKAAVLR